MTVVLTVSKTLGGASPADVLTGGATGYQWGQSETGVAPSTFPVYASHNGAAQISNLAVNAQPMSGTYGGDYSANTDLTKLATLGDAAAGLQMDFGWNAAPPFSGAFQQFKTGVGMSFSTRLTIPATAMAKNTAGVLAGATAPVAGGLGSAGDSVLGDTAVTWCRFVAPEVEAQTGKRQFDLYYSFNFTS